MALSDVKMRNLKPREKPYKVSDGEGLFVLVNPNGSKLWRLAYRFGGKQKTIAFGSYPAVSLLEARRKTGDARDRLAKGIDPSAKEDILRAPEGITFEALAREWHDLKTCSFVPAYADRQLSRLKNDLFPYLGERPVTEIEPPEVLAAIRVMEKRGAVELARKVKQLCGQIFRYGIATGRCNVDPTHGLNEALRPAGRKRHHSSLDENELPEFFERLSRYDGEPQVVLALRLTVLTFVRTQETRFAEWSEFEDLDGPNPVWRIPAERMKMRREHIVPLSRQAVEVVRQVRLLSPERFLFPSTRHGKVISENTMLFAMYRMGYHSRATVHGFRHLASTVLNEHEWNSDWIEMQLAHVQGGVRGVYNAAKYLTQRRQMMQWWADWLDKSNGCGLIVCERSDGEPTRAEGP